jgi:hypothetical protein
MLLVINLPLIGLWVRLLRVPYRLLFPCIVVLCWTNGCAEGGCHGGAGLRYLLVRLWSMWPDPH